MFTVSVTLPDLGGDTPEEAAEVFWQVLDEYRDGGYGSIYVDVEGRSKPIELDPTTGKVVQE